MLDLLQKVWKAVVPAQDVWMTVYIEINALLHQVLGKDVVRHDSKFKERSVF